MPNDPDTLIRSLTFLVVEDDAFMQDLAVTTLGLIGATDIATAFNGKLALDYLQSASSPPDVVFIDIRMPEMGGVELMRHLAEQKFAGAIIIASGIDEETVSVAEEMAKMKNLNVLGHIKKPLGLDALRDILNRRLSK